MNKKILILSLCIGMLVAFLAPSYAQSTKKVSGSVVLSSGEPVAGAIVKQEGTTNGTLTDIDGKFTISVPENAQLTISFIGYVSQTISDLSKTKITLVEDALQLDDVVVVGYGTQKKAHLTSAVATTDMNDVADLSTSDMASALRGLMNGVSVSSSSTSRPGATSRISIRENNVVAGLSTAAETDPLYVIDGYAYPIEDGSRAFNNLDASMIESISVLKDASAAIYGSRAGNGVILVTTKRGKVGKPKISYNGQFGMADAIAHPDMLSAYQYGKVWNAVRAANPVTTPYDSRTDLFQADELEAMKGMDYNLLEDQWTAAFTQKHSVNVGGGSDNVNYFAGLSYYTQDGNIGNLQYERWNYNAGMDMKVNQWVKVSMQVAGNYGGDTKAYNGVSSATNAEADYNRLLTQPRYIPSTIDGRYIASYGIINNTQNDSQLYNFEAVQNSGDYKENMNQEMSVNTGLEYDFGWSRHLKGLKMKFTYGKNISTTKSNQLGTGYTLYTMVDRGGSGDHLYTGDFSDANFIASEVTNKGMVDRTMTRTDSYQMNFATTYARKFGDHDLNALFAMEKSEREYEDIYASRNDLYPNANGQSSTTSNDASSKDNRFARTESGTLSYIGRINYAYKSKYLVEFLLRSDASTKFAPENYWGTFPSTSLGWVMSEEDWFKEKVSFFDYMKLRGSFGLTGRDNIPAWTWSKYYQYTADRGPIFGASNTASGSYIVLPNSGFNRNAKWDKSYKSNFGIDMAMLDNRLSFNIDGYYEWNRDIFTALNNSIPSTVGSNPANENYSAINTYGIEIGAAWKSKIGNDFKYGIRLNTGYSDNRLKKMNWPTTKELDGIVENERNDRGTWGMQSMGIFRSYQDIEEYFDKYQITNYLGMSKADMRPGMLIYKDVRSTARDAEGNYVSTPDGVIDSKADRVKISDRSSNIYGFTMNLNAEWKSLSFSAQFNASWGSYTTLGKNIRAINNSVLNTSGYTSMQYTNLPAFWANNMFTYEDVLDAQGNVVAEANRDAKYPNLMYDSVNNLESTFWKVKDASVALRNVTVAYKLPSNLVQKAGIESCRVNFTIQNALNFYNSYPEKFYSSFAGTYGQYPNLRRFTLGISASF
ncbi:MAG: SusC/RagA family TonB-linked outer membrane protein [Mangrovibacterium sp.]